MTLPSVNPIPSDAIINVSYSTNVCNPSVTSISWIGYQATVNVN